MNKRIQELYKQAWGHFPCPTGEPELEKFAELIVRECVQFIFVLDAEPMSHKSAARLLQEHFGVE